MSDLKEIKRRLISQNKIEDLLSAIGCEYISTEQRGNMYTAQLPERFYSNNKRSVQVRLNESLSCFIRSRADFKGDIFDLVNYIHFDKRGQDMQKSLHEAKEFICELFGWNEFKHGFNKKMARKDYTASLKAIAKERKKRVEIKPNPVIPESIMEDYYYDGFPISYEKWIEEGISQTTQEIYGIGIDLSSHRIVFPLRNRFGKLVGVKGRIIRDEDDPERKYLYIEKCQNRYEWFNWYIAHPYILEHNEVYIFESEKSCMKAFEHGIYNTLAIGASDISPEQAQMIRQLGFDINVILCYDKGITIDEIKRQAEIFEGRQIHAVYDIDNLLKDKNSPIDQGIDTWNKLLENNIYEVMQKS